MSADASPSTTAVLPATTPVQPSARQTDTAPPGSAPSLDSDAAVARALSSDTRRAIFSRLQERREPATVRDVAADFELHPNVARTHLQMLAGAGLLTVGRRKHPGGGRPARMYTAVEDILGSSPDDREQGRASGASPSGQADLSLVVRLLAALLDAPGVDPSGRVVVASRPTTLAARAHEAAALEAARLVAAARAAPDVRENRLASLAEAADIAVRALQPWIPQARVLRVTQDWVELAGVRTLFATLVGSRPELADALERGLIAGALAAAGAPVVLGEAPAEPSGERRDPQAPARGPVWRARRVTTPSARAGLEPARTVDARGQNREAGVVRAMRTATGLRAGDVLEVLAEGPGSPAAFARWADRAGHELLGVERATDADGRAAIRLLIRKGG